MSTTDITEAVFAKLKTFAHDPLPAILWPGIQETPPETGMWLQPGHFPNEPHDIAWDNGACVDTRGFAQVLVYFRPGQGVIDPG